ncbi:MAG: hypothetical protein JST40_03900 [Armatimonadetes bacterium]|nr:hypothetical protein [Armatimonadota bacterium]
MTLYRTGLALACAMAAGSALALDATLTLDTPNVTIDLLHGSSYDYEMSGTVRMGVPFNGFVLWIPYAYREGAYAYRNDYTIHPDLLQWLQLQLGNPGTYHGKLFTIQMDPMDLGGMYNHVFYSLTALPNCYVYINGNNQDRSNEVPYTIQLITPGRINAHVDLQDYYGDVSLEYASITVRNSNNDESYYFEPLDANGNFTLETNLSGPAEILVSVGHWLRGTSGQVTLGEPTNINFSLVNGDIDGDNAITIFDYVALSDSFDAGLESENWNPYADLDGDGVVSIFDYVILSQNFDQYGAE